MVRCAFAGVVLQTWSCRCGDTGVVAPVWWYRCGDNGVVVQVYEVRYETLPYGTIWLCIVSHGTVR